MQFIFKMAPLGTKFAFLLWHKNAKKVFFYVLCEEIASYIIWLGGLNVFLLYWFVFSTYSLFASSETTFKWWMCALEPGPYKPWGTPSLGSGPATSWNPGFALPGHVGNELWSLNSRHPRQLCWVQQYPSGNPCWSFGSCCLWNHPFLGLVQTWTRTWNHCKSGFPLEAGKCTGYENGVEMRWLMEKVRPINPSSGQIEIKDWAGKVSRIYGIFFLTFSLSFFLSFLSTPTRERKSRLSRTIWLSQKTT